MFSNANKLLNGTPEPTASQQGSLEEGCFYECQFGSIARKVSQSGGNGKTFRGAVQYSGRNSFALERFERKKVTKCGFVETL